MDHDASMRLQEAAEAEFIAMAERIEAGGHSPADVAEVLVALGIARVAMLAANRDTEAAIARARATVSQ